ncbi:ABC-F family ATP-binding cassette domain-containing protein [Gramella sp. KN1008]|uniref:ABC-F family ATP-binding cassette domain-containing protein n=1 Tax=Gramella sp. KN1008 TaxID=2529298 RepID=UPI00103AF84A|nr:ABC-F family ATP-binding cassette domain-containing protein [Gramella sp. KN1008]TBW27975.1 ABC transporter ATP-binding protein [Gramella sp. KN1008]
MLNIHNLSVSFAGEYLFKAISFRLGAGDRVGLIGKNGAGKSTLLKIIAGEQEYDSGQIARDKELKIGFLKQDLDFERGRTVVEEAHQAFTEIKALENKMAEINSQLATRTDYESESYNELIQDLSEITHKYEIIGGYNYEGDTEKVLQGLGFERDDFNKPTDTFSGGWRMRIELAKLLLQNNDILLLDEPTNHLDIESIIWLEGFLNNYPGSVMLVSHDKMFLNNVTNRSIEISLGNIYDYRKPYSEFMEFRKELREQQLAAQKNQQKEIEQTEKLIDKFRAKASKASMAQSLIKKLEKIDRIEVDEDDNAVMSVNFPVSVNPGKVVLEAEHLEKSYGEKKVLSDLNFMVERQSKIAFVGQNGQGKTTLAKIIVGEIPYDGTLKLGHNVQLGYFAQNQAEYLDGEKTVLQTMEDAANEKNRTKVRDMLGAFLFRGDEVEKKVKVLSGGERNRLALCKMLLEPFNVLVMDEPTNHLDIKSKNVLKKALKNFEGTLILVSHDRDFLQNLTGRIYEFRNHKITEYLGDIDYYLEQRKLQDMRAVEKSEKVKASKTRKETAQKRSFSDQKEIKKIKNRLSKTEAKITKLEKELKAKDKELAENYEKTATKPDFLNNYNSSKKKLEKLMEEWEQLQLELDEMNQE